MKRLALFSALLALGGTLVVASSGLGTAAVAQVGAANDFDVWLSASDVRISSGACRDIPFTVTHNAGYLDRFTAAAEVWRGGQYLDQTFDYLYDSAGPLTGSYTWCPSMDGVGQFRVGPTAVEWNSYGADREGSFTDASTATFWVKQDQRCSITRARKSQGRLTVTGKARWFSIDDSRWSPSPRGAKVALQRQVGTSWKTIKVARIGQRGLVQLTARAPRSKQTYRVLQAGTARTWSCSATVQR